MINYKNYKGLIIGSIFTASSLLLTFTFIVPIITVSLAGVFFETIAKNLVDNDPYSNVGKMTIWLLAGVLLVVSVISVLIIREIKQKNGFVSNGKIVLTMFLFYFLVHPLGFYIYWGIELNFRSDGQLMFATMDSFPGSSMSFIFFGLIIDLVKNTATKKEM
ncbi:MAG: hypothetical protein ACXVPU_08350 [Bacteroidia bacterium]